MQNIVKIVLSVFLSFTFTVLSASNKDFAVKNAATGISFPLKIGKLVRNRITDFTERAPALGIGYNYTTSGIYATIFIYNGGYREIPDSLESEIFKHHFKIVEKDLYIFEQRGEYRNLQKVLDEITCLTKNGPVKARHSEYIFMKNDMGVPLLSISESHIYLFVYKSHFIKIRYTYLIGKNKETALKQLQNLLKFLSDSISANKKGTTDK